VVRVLTGADAWTLDPDLAYLNHGGYGATPAPVQRAQLQWRAALERNPAGFLVRELPGLLAGVRQRLAGFLGADEDGLVFTDNATTGTQTVIAHIRLGPGDELLTTDHCYPAVLAQLRRAAETSGATLRIAAVPLPAREPAGVAGAVVSRLTPRTRLLVIDHVASCSGLVFPVAEIAAACREAGVPVLVDGAHAAGMLPVDLAALGADFWVGNLHKWVCAPKASAVLYAAPPWRPALRPLVASHGLFDGYRPAFDWTGTRDPSALLAVPAALDFFDAIGWPKVRDHNNDLARRGAGLVAERLGTGPPAIGPELAAAMCLVPLPVPSHRPLDAPAARALENRLAGRGVVAPVTCLDGWRWVRVSAQLYNRLADYERLAAALGDLSSRTASPDLAGSHGTVREATKATDRAARPRPSHPPARVMTATSPPARRAGRARRRSGPSAWPRPRAWPGARSAPGHAALRRRGCAPAA
jgi:isopenicillin-N epimerase